MRFDISLESLPFKKLAKWKVAWPIIPLVSRVLSINLYFAKFSSLPPISYLSCLDIQTITSDLIITLSRGESLRDVIFVPIFAAITKRNIYMYIYIANSDELRVSSAAERQCRSR